MPARLLGLRVQGFKSFAERTRLEFGAGISAIVGPNGSGKSNLADALRWALGEQGRSLRIRRSEDVIWAGSERRGALGMADVTLVLDNADALLPVDFGIVELGRRLYRSGENEYLVNRQRVRLRDLVDLLDGAHLAENAFLFIGQGMVDQALALRPEERRPLFEEVAGVRRHERRKRRAEAQLEEAEANLTRVEDILAELRPQARRLGLLAEQQASRLAAGEELAAALVAAARARWHSASARVAAADVDVRTARDATARALQRLEAAERTVTTLANALAARSGTERALRAGLDAARAACAGLEVREARIGAELAALDRDRERIIAGRTAAESDLEAHRRTLAEPLPEPDAALGEALAEADRALGEARAEIAALRGARLARAEADVAARRARAAREAELESAGRRVAEAARRAAEERDRAVEVMTRRRALEASHAISLAALEAATAARQASADRRAEAGDRADAAEGSRRAAAELAARLGAALAGMRGRVEAIRRAIDEQDRHGMAPAARRAGGRRIDAELGVDPALRDAIETLLGERTRAFVVDRGAVARLARERGHLVVREGVDAEPGAGDATRAERRLDETVAALGGGRLDAAILRDPTGAVRALAARVVWVPDLDAALEIQALLPVGWAAVVRDGSAVVDALSVRLGRGDSPLARRAELERLERERADLELELVTAEEAVESAARAAREARAAAEAARRAEAEADAAARRAGDAERAAGRDAEAGAREATWHRAQADRLDAEADRERSALRTLEETALPAVRTGARDGSPDADGDAGDTERSEADGALAVWERRHTELRARRDRLAARVAEAERSRRDAELRAARAEAEAALAETRLVSADRELESWTERRRLADTERGSVIEELAAATAREAQARTELERVLADDAGDRARLTEAERVAGVARDRLRAADARARAADVSRLEARLALDALREQVLVEMAGLGDPAIRHLEASGPPPAATSPAPRGDPDAGTEPIDGDEARRLEAALDAVGPAWATAAPAEPPPTPARLAAIRRRYHDLGAANPFAVEEYRALRERLDSLESQDRDLRAAVATTRSLIADLDALIATQFRTTFAALEQAFDARFRQLFGGGFARLSLTDPQDLAATGVEIVARPPGKKAQALAMLSGGERALTAVALLFAMLEVRPVPFCVLDEVDAALDEANIGRFVDALRELAATTQCIIITHNRGTIEAADALYGVTAGDDSVSRVVSLRLDEATAIVEAAQPHGPGSLASTVR